VDPVIRTSCSRCGDCCEQIWLTREWVESVEHRLATSDEPPPAGSNVAFIAEHWNEIERDDTDVRYRCDQFDQTRRVCMAHDQRPPVCSGFPWYGDQPGSNDRVHPRCTFWLDVPPDQRRSDARPLLPIITCQAPAVPSASEAI
jgi:Fe-S-cluster containining protein